MLTRMALLMKRIRLSFLSVALVGLLFVQPLKAAPIPVLSIAAVVNDTIISAFDMQMRLKLVMATSGLPGTPDNLKKLAPQALRMLVDDTLKLQEAAKFGVDASAEEIERAKQMLEKQNGLPDGGLNRLLAQARIPSDALTAQIKPEVIWVKLVGRKFGAKEQPTDAEIDDKLAEIKADIAKPKVRLLEIFLPIRQGKKAQAKATANRIVSEIRSGANFALIARQFSESPAAARGGDLGWVTMEQIGKELAPVVDGMAPGSISDPIQTATGYYIVKLLKRQTQKDRQVAETSVKMTQLFLPASSAYARMGNERAALLKKVGSTKSCDAFGAAGQKHGLPAAGMIVDIDVRKAPVVIQDTLLTQPLHVAATPIKVEGGETLIMLCDRTISSLVPDREQVARVMKSERLERRSVQYLRTIRRNAVIDIRQ